MSVNVEHIRALLSLSLANAQCTCPGLKSFQKKFAQFRQQVSYL